MCNCENIQTPSAPLYRKVGGAMLGLGLTPASARRVSPVPAQLLALVPKPVDNMITVKPTVPDVEKDTMPLIVSKARRTAWQVAKLAPKLQGASLAQTLKNVSAFVLDHIKYVKDHPEHEQVRSPRRTIHDAKGDCDCMSVLIAALLINLKIPFRFRVAKYGSSQEWSHIYIIVPHGSTHTTMDPVTNRHDYEVTFSQKKDFDMALQSLDGFGACSPDKIMTKNRQMMVPIKTLLRRGYSSSAETLTKMGVPYEIYGDNLIVQTKSGAKLVPSIMVPAQAGKLLSGLGEDTAPEAKKFPWLEIALVIGTWAIYNASKTKSNALNGTGGRKLPVLHL